MTTTATEIENMQFHQGRENDEEIVVVEIGMSMNIGQNAWSEGLGQRVIAQAVRNRRSQVEQQVNNQDRQSSVIVSCQSLIVDEQTESFLPEPQTEPLDLSVKKPDEDLFKVPFGRAPKRKLDMKDAHWNSVESEGSKFAPKLKINPNQYQRMNLNVPVPAPEAPHHNDRVIKYAKRSTEDIHDIIQELWLIKCLKAPIYNKIFHPKEKRGCEEIIQQHFRKSLSAEKFVTTHTQRQQELGGQSEAKAKL